METQLRDGLETKSEFYEKAVLARDSAKFLTLGTEAYFNNRGKALMKAYTHLSSVKRYTETILLGEETFFPGNPNEVITNKEEFMEIYGENCLHQGFLKRVKNNISTLHKILIGSAATQSEVEEVRGTLEDISGTYLKQARKKSLGH